MNDLQFGLVVRSVRHRRRWTQQALGVAAGVSDAQVSRIERGQLDAIPLAAVRRVAAVLEIRVELLARWRGGDLDRLVNAGHSLLHESVARWFADRHPDWILAPEVSFAIGSERGVIDQLAYQPAHRTVLVVELKTVIADVNELLGVLDRKRRLARRVAGERGWITEHVGTVLIVTHTRTNERRLAAHASVLRVALPADGRGVRAWLNHPTGACAGVLLWRQPILVTTGRQRVRTRPSQQPDMPTKATGRTGEGGRAMGPA